MALTYACLGSGSSGNVLWLKGGETSLLVDCGLTAKATEERLSAIGAKANELEAILITHTHGDHIRGASVLARRYGMALWASPLAAAALPRDIPPEQIRTLPPDLPLLLGALTIRSVRTQHDAPGSVAYTIADHETRFGIVTDTGIAHPELSDALKGLDGLVLEMNHDVALLRSGSYPGYLKKRILGNWGHLSNEQGAELLTRVHHPGLSHLTLAHLSEENNTPDLARRAAEERLEALGAACRLEVAGPREPMLPVRLSSPPARRATPLGRADRAPA